MRSIIVVLAALAMSPVLANADAIITVVEVGGDVVFSTTGSLDLTGAVGAQSGASYGQGFISGGSNWYVAPGPGGAYETYAMTAFDGPFGTSGAFVTPPSSSSGGTFFIWGNDGIIAQVGVADGYVSGSAINSGMVFNGATIAGLLMTPGTYTYEIPNDTITLIIAGGAAVPEPSTLALLGLGIVGIGLSRRRKMKSV